jgi:hypothetical protein
MCFARLHERLRCYEQVDSPLVISSDADCACVVVVKAPYNFAQNTMSQFLNLVVFTPATNVDPRMRPLFLLSYVCHIHGNCEGPEKFDSCMPNAFDSDILRDRIMLVLPNPIPFPS